MKTIPERTVCLEKHWRCFSTLNTPAIDGVVTHEPRHRGGRENARQGGGRRSVRSGMHIRQKSPINV